MSKEHGSLDSGAEAWGGGLAGTASRVLDLFVGSVAVLIFAPLMLLIATLVVVLDPGPIFFGHQRIGLNGRPFRCWKFRSMVVDADARLAALLEHDQAVYAEWQRDHKLRDDPRITRLGAFLRKSSLDELPQLFNVLIGEMSLVGPRPIVVNEIKRYGRYFDDYCQVRPGITGLWQVSGRNDVTYRRRVALDVAYVRSKCLKLDIKILLLTIPRVVMSRGSY